MGFNFGVKIEADYFVKTEATLIKVMFVNLWTGSTVGHLKL